MCACATHYPLAGLTGLYREGKIVDPPPAGLDFGAGEPGGAWAGASRGVRRGRA